MDAWEWFMLIGVGVAALGWIGIGLAFWADQTEAKRWEDDE